MNSGELALEVIEWAERDMRWRAAGSVPLMHVRHKKQQQSLSEIEPRDLEQLLRGPGIRRLFEYVVRHVRRRSVALLVHENLRLRGHCPISSEKSEPGTIENACPKDQLQKKVDIALGREMQDHAGIIWAGRIAIDRANKGIEQLELNRREIQEHWRPSLKKYWTQLREMLDAAKTRAGKRVLDEQCRTALAASKEMELDREAFVKRQAEEQPEGEENVVQMKSLEELLEEQRGKMLQEFEAAQRAMNDALLNTELLKGEWKAALKLPEDIQALMEAQAKLRGLQLAVQYLRKEINQLALQLRDSELLQQRVDDSRTQIEHNAEHIKEKFSAIHAAIMANQQSRHLLDRQQRDIQSMLEPLKQQSRDVAQLCTNMHGKDRSFAEVHAYPIERDASTVRRWTDIQLDKRRAGLGTVARAISIPWWKGAEAFLYTISDHAIEESQRKLEHDLDSQGLQRHSLRQDQIDLSKKLEEELKAYESSVLQEWIPRLENTRTFARQTVHECDKTRSVLHDWRDQPAQLLIRGEQRRGLTLQEWLSRWRKLNLLLEELQQKFV